VEISEKSNLLIPFTFSLSDYVDEVFKLHGGAIIQEIGEVFF
jgi:hypothetical protein